MHCSRLKEDNCLVRGLQMLRAMFEVEIENCFLTLGSTCTCVLLVYKLDRCVLDMLITWGFSLHAITRLLVKTDRDLGAEPQQFSQQIAHFVCLVPLDSIKPTEIEDCLSAALLYILSIFWTVNGFFTGCGFFTCLGLF